MTTPPKDPAVVKKPVQRKKPVAKRTVKPKPPAKKQTETGFKHWPAVITISALILFSPFYYRFITQGFTAAWHWVNDIGEDPDYRHYKSFNIHVSEKYTIHGIDVSYAQGKIDWPKVKAMDENGLHISFAFIKATDGENYTDPTFQRNWREAAKTGLICGAYHFFRPEKNGKEQAKLFLKTVRLERNDMPLVIDIEKLDGTTPAQMRISLDQCLSYLKYRTTAKPIIYSGLSFYQDYLKGFFDEYPLWIAHYDKPELRINQSTNWQFWQHTDKATVNGIHHAVDFDTFKGDSVAFKQLLVQ
ncbi:glycoside hydrolase family 25 protein [Mucilaginibacter agri]|uniref:Glycoside hydrolase family 25 protein n=1 Tax=Mucilaginibacter agri TaxID=2695265 RepID=A0A965ZHK3_9SPHI|nr:GH25 family lysozyme [Mucilaginibacter agri]NCD71160.1 glycoside hydrolase family 25 protein [Mucilaginibacter agri]